MAKLSESADSQIKRGAIELWNDKMQRLERLTGEMHSLKGKIRDAEGDADDGARKSYMGLLA